MKERPVLFSAPMVRALLDGSKTQTRRALNPQPVWIPNWGMAGAWRVGSPAGMGLSDHGDHWSATLDDETIRRYAAAEAYGWGARAGCPYGQPSDRLWVRENFSGPHCMEHSDAYPAMPPGQWPKESPIWYWADGEPTHGDWTRPRPSIHMPRWASRITLEIVSVRVERLRDISKEDAIAEGIEFDGMRDLPSIESGVDLWRHYGTGGNTVCEVTSYQSLWESLSGPDSWAANPWVWAVEFKKVEHE